MPAGLDEGALAAGEPPAAGAEKVARAKAASVAAVHPGHIVLAADTIVVLDGGVLGKPTDAEDARRMLCALRDRWHLVATAVVLRSGSAGEGWVVESRVRMRAYTDSEITTYVASGGGEDKAGSYGVQDAPFHPVAAMDGCYCNVMGLPLWTTTQLLERVGYVVPRRPSEAYARCEDCPLAPGCAARGP